MNGDDWDEFLTREEWWAEFHANACCPNPQVAARPNRTSQPLPTGYVRKENHGLPIPQR